MDWQVDEAGKQLDDVIRAAEADGAQFVIEDGRRAFAVLGIADYRQLTEGSTDPGV